jgi:hypothetical protein
LYWQLLTIDGFIYSLSNTVDNGISSGSLSHYRYKHDEETKDKAATAQAFSYNRIDPGGGHDFSIFLSGTNGGHVFDCID